MVLGSAYRRRAIPGVEHVEGDAYRRTVVIDGDPGVLELRPGGPLHLILFAHLPHWADLIHLVNRARRIASLDSDLDEPLAQLSGDALLAPLITARPGLRVPGTWDPFETGVRAIIGQQVSITGATTIIGRLVARLGTTVPGLGAMGLTHTFPSPETLAGADLTGLGLTHAREGAITAFARAVADGDILLDRSVGLDDLVNSITAITGLGGWTAHYVALRLGEPDAFPATDLGIRRVLAPHGPGVDERWRPWRSLATSHLWAASGAGAS